MARLVISTFGRYGDILPYLALGRSLRDQGNQVRLATSASYAALVRQAGLDFFPCRPDQGPALVRQRSAEWNHWSERTIRIDPARFDLPGRFADCCAACAGDDLLLAAPGQLAAELVHEYTALPWLSLSVAPAHFSGLARQTEPLTDFTRQFADLFNGFRRLLGLAVLPEAAYRRVRFASRILLGASPHFCRPAEEYAAAIMQTGFWFDKESVSPGWNPPPDLVAFLASDPPPLLLAFSSQPVADQAAVVERYAAAASALELPLLVQSGWAGLGEHLAPGALDSARVKIIGHAPHDYLFPRVTAVLHHGGIGTIARALLHGRPMLVEPYGNDQFYNALRVVQLGVGAAIQPHRASASSIAWLLREKVLVAGCRARAAELGAAIAREDGLGEARRIIGTGITA